MQNNREQIDCYQNVKTKLTMILKCKDQNNVFAYIYIYICFVLFFFEIKKWCQKSLAKIRHSLPIRYPEIRHSLPIRYPENPLNRLYNKWNLIPLIARFSSLLSQSSRCPQRNIYKVYINLRLEIFYLLISFDIIRSVN